MLLKLMENELIVYIVIAALVLIMIQLIIYSLYRKKKNTKSNDSIEFYKVPDSKTKVNETQESAPSELEKVIEQMQQDLENRDIEATKTFEEEQEEKSIISYQELLKANQVNKSVTIDEVDSIYEDDEKLVEETTDEVETPIELERPKFKKSEFISPIYGRVENDYTYPIIKNFKESDEETLLDNFDQDESIQVEEKELEKTLNLEPITNEIKKSEDFLNSLREFRKNLE